MMAPVAAGIFGATRRRLEPSVSLIQAVVADHYGLEVEDMRSSARAARIAQPRQVAMYFSRILTRRSYPELARIFRRKDHTTIIHGFRQTAKRRQVDACLARDLRLIRTELEAAR